MGFGTVSFGTLGYQNAAWLFAGLFLLVVEVFALARGDEPLTTAMRAGSARWFLWPALFGTLGGHFWGSRGGPSWGPWLLAAALAAILWRDLVVRTPVPQSTHLEVLLLFTALGAWLWGVR